MDNHLRPLVLPVPLRAPERHGPADIYPPDDVTVPRPGILFVHGGPVPAELRPTPRDWPMFQGYASLVAARSVVGMTADLRLHSPADYPLAEDDLRSAIDTLRTDPRVDPDRIALWFFSGGALLSTSWLRDPPPWLRCLALTYPGLIPFPGWTVDPRFRPVEAVPSAGPLPIILTRAGRDFPPVTEGTRLFLAAAPETPIEIIDVPEGQHSFDILDNTDQSREAINRAADLVLATLEK
jgi:acetyl esterase/lipase